MEFRKYDNIESFGRDILNILLRNEACNNLMISWLLENRSIPNSDWLMATVSDNDHILLAALWSKPFNLMLYEDEHHRSDAAMDFLARNVRLGRYSLPGVLAEQTTAKRFAYSYLQSKALSIHNSMVAMQLDRLIKCDRASGLCRALSERDMFYTPYWERAFSEDCKSHVFSITECQERIRTRLGKNTHFIWQDGVPVSQAVFGRGTPSGAVINWVYTPPYYRGRGYATSVVAELSASLLGQGKRFCCLFADTQNHISQKIYRKLGYYDICVYDDIRFDT